MYKKMVNDWIKRVDQAFLSLMRCAPQIKKTCLLSFSKLMRASCLSNFKPEVARMVFRARVGVYDIKEIFKRKYDSDPRQLHENFEHIFQCNLGIFCRRFLRGTTLYELATIKDTQKTIDEFLVKY